MQNLLSEYRTIKNIDMGVGNKGCCVLKYPHSIDDGLLALYIQGLTIREISKKVEIPYETVRRRLKEKGAKTASPRFVIKFGDIRYRGSYRYWSEDEERRFKEYFPFHTNEEVAEEFCCKISQVKINQLICFIMPVIKNVGTKSVQGYLDGGYFLFA